MRRLVRTSFERFVPGVAATTCNQAAWSLDTVWGSSAVWSTPIAWGSDVVWESAGDVWAEHIVWGTNYVGTSTDGQHIVWGTADQPSTTVWSDLSDSAEIGGASIDPNGVS